MRSFAAKVLAVRYVVEKDSEPGVDGVRWHTAGEMMRAALSLTSKNYRAKPYRHIVIHEENKNRPINVPTAYDKAIQILYAFSLDPVAESVGERKSFAFRKGRSMLDAHAYICKALRGSHPPEWVLRADIKSCYDSISHDWLLKHIPMDKKVLHEFLRAGFVDCGKLFPTKIGVSQGSTLSPILGNMTLDGLQKYIFSHLYPDGKPDYLNGNLIRFADDILCTARTEEQAKKIKDILEKFLSERGLALHPDKTYIRHISQGFDFLSRWYQYKDGILMDLPSEQAINDFEHRLENFINGFTGSQKTLILTLNRKLLGWAHYHRITDTRDAFKRIDAVVQTLLARKMRKLHPKRQWEHVHKKYWQEDNRGNPVFCLEENPAVRVVRLGAMVSTFHQPVKTNFHPYLDREYYEYLKSKREIQKVSGPEHQAIWCRQDGRCFYCDAPMLRDQIIDLVEIEFGRGPKGE